MALFIIYHFFPKFLGYCILDIIVFTVSPGAHVCCPPGEGVEVAGASLVDSGVYSEDLSIFYHFGCAVTVDLFVSSVVDSVGDGGDRDLGFEPCLHDFWRGGIVGWIWMGLSGLCFVETFCCWAVVVCVVSLGWWRLSMEC